MAKITSTRQSSSTSHRSRANQLRSLWSFPIEKQNLIFFGGALGTILLGYVLMSMGTSSDPVQRQSVWNSTIAISISPIVLVIGYCVLVPLGIMKFTKAESSADTEQQTN